MINEKELAITAAFTWLADGVPDGTPAGPLLEAFRKAIVVYDAEKWLPTRWKAIKDAPCDGSWILVFRPYRDHALSDGGTLDLAFFARDADAFMLAGRQHPRSLDQLVHDGAMFQAIDPPPPKG